MENTRGICVRAWICLCQILVIYWTYNREIRRKAMKQKWQDLGESEKKWKVAVKGLQQTWSVLAKIQKSIIILECVSPCFQVEKELDRTLTTNAQSSNAWANLYTLEQTFFLVLFLLHSRIASSMALRRKRSVEDGQQPPSKNSHKPDLVQFFTLWNP